MTCKILLREVKTDWMNYEEIQEVLKHDSFNNGLNATPGGGQPGRGPDTKPTYVDVTNKSLAELEELEEIKKNMTIKYGSSKSTIYKTRSNNRLIENTIKMKQLGLSK